MVCECHKKPEAINVRVSNAGVSSLSGAIYYLGGLRQRACPDESGASERTPSAETCSVRECYI